MGHSGIEKWHSFFLFCQCVEVLLTCCTQTDYVSSFPHSFPTGEDTKLGEILIHYTRRGTKHSGFDSIVSSFNLGDVMQAMLLTSVRLATVDPETNHKHVEKFWDYSLFLPTSLEAWKVCIIHERDEEGYGKIVNEIYTLQAELRRMRISFIDVDKKSMSDVVDSSSEALLWSEKIGILYSITCGRIFSKYPTFTLWCERENAFYEDLNSVQEVLEKIK